MTVATTITPDWTLNRLKQEFPGVELALFAHFGVGSRERSGFAGTEILEDLLRRHLVFDAARACQRLSALALEDRENEISAHALSSQNHQLVDVRSEDDYARAHLPGSLLFSAQTVAQLEPERLVITLCRDGAQAPAASRFLRGKGFQARHLSGGITAWAEQVDPNFPILFPLKEWDKHWHLLADGQTLRWRSDLNARSRECRLWTREALAARPEFAPALAGLPELELVVAAPGSLSFRGLPRELLGAIEALSPWRTHQGALLAGGQVNDPEAELAEIERILREVAPEILQSHKGTVEVESYHQRVLTLKLGGGCAGCASAQVTTQRELAAELYRQVPTIDRIQNHED